MGLKGDRLELITTQSYFMNEVATRGGVVVGSTGGSGAANDQSAALVTYAANPSGKMAVGLLLNDMVNIDQTRQMINKHKDEVQKGQKVTLLQRGWVVTNMIATADSPDAFDTAYLGGSGLLMSTGTGYDTQVGYWESSKDEDGYAKVSVNLPARGVRT